jgi:hypothetical protein
MVEVLITLIQLQPILATIFAPVSFLCGWCCQHTAYVLCQHVIPI